MKKYFSQKFVDFLTIGQFLIVKLKTHTKALKHLINNHLQIN